MEGGPGGFALAQRWRARMRSDEGRPFVVRFQFLTAIMSHRIPTETERVTVISGSFISQPEKRSIEIVQKGFPVLSVSGPLE